MGPVNRCDEAGLSLVEVLVASILTLVALLMAYQILNATTSTAGTITNRAHNSTQARITIDTVENSLRLAKGVWVCAPVTSTPLVSGSASSSCPTYTSGNAALLVSNDKSPTCSEWILDSNGLSQVALGTPSNGTFAVTPVTNIPGVTPATYNGTATAGFTLPSGFTGTSNANPPVAVANRLVQIDLSVNQDLDPPFRSSDAVTVHDVIAPDNLMTSDDTTSTPCS